MNGTFKCTFIIFIIFFAFHARATVLETKDIGIIKDEIAKLKKEAMYNGDPGDGEAVFVPGLTRISEEEHSEQLDRMKAGLIPSMNDLGAWKAAQDTYNKYGSDD